MNKMEQHVGMSKSKREKIQNKNPPTMMGIYLANLNLFDPFMNDVVISLNQLVLLQGWQGREWMSRSWLGMWMR